jgi:hypothetical protein
VVATADPATLPDKATWYLVSPVTSVEDVAAG